MNWSVVIRDAVIAIVMVFFLAYYMPTQIHRYLNTQSYAKSDTWRPDPHNQWEIEDMPEDDEEKIDPSLYFDDLDIFKDEK